MRKEVIGDATLYCGDCLEILPTLGRVDAVVTDPPYGIGFKYTASYVDRAGDAYRALIEVLRGRPVALLQYPEEMMRMVVPVLGPPDEVLTWIYNSNLARQSRLWGIWGCDVDPRRALQPAKNPTDKRASSLVGGYDWRHIEQVKNVCEDKSEHPCQLPVDVAQWVITCIKANTILDPFMGSGTTGVAALQLGRKFIGIEIDESYFSIACRRIEEAWRQPRLFEEPKAKPAPHPSLFEGLPVTKT